MLATSLSAQLNTQMKPDGINFRDGNTIGSFFSWDGSVLGLYNATGKTGHMEIGSGGEIIFQSGGTVEQLRLSSLGRLGLGTSNPGAKLDILHHTTNTIPHLELTESTPGEFGQFRFSNSNSANYWHLSARSDTDPAFSLGHFDGTETINLLSMDAANKQTNIGSPSLFSPNATLEVHNSEGGDQSTLGNTYDIYTRPVPSIWTRYGLYTYVSGAAEGVDINTQGQKIGIASNARSSGAIKTAVAAYAGIGTGTNYGVHTTVNGIGGAESYALYAQASGGSSTSTPPVWAGYFAGDVFTTGNYLPSDQKLKSGIRKAGSSLERLSQLQVKTYRYETKYQQKMGLDQRSQTGFLAHEVESVFPELTREVAQPLNSPEEIAGGQKEAFLHFTGVNYVGFIPHLTQAIQEQQGQIETQQKILLKQQDQINELQATNRALEERLARLEAHLANGGLSHQSPSIVVPLTGAQLQQNAPNPFSKTSRISYFIPEGVQRAELEIIDTNGRLLKNISIDSRGNGQVELAAQSLSAGQYTYRLRLDGRVISSKQMVITN